jgi:hypothetical protein
LDKADPIAMLNALSNKKVNCQIVLLLRCTGKTYSQKSAGTAKDAAEF